MTSNPELWEALLPVVDALLTLDVLYCVGGSVASSFAGVARATLDVDLVADLRLEHVQRFADALIASYYVDFDMISEAIKRRGTFNLMHLPTMFKIDVFVMEATDFARANMARRVALEIHTRPLAVHPKMIHTHDPTFFGTMTCARLHEGFASVDQ